MAHIWVIEHNRIGQEKWGYYMSTKTKKVAKEIIKQYNKDSGLFKWRYRVRKYIREEK